MMTVLPCPEPSRLIAVVTVRVLVQVLLPPGVVLGQEGIITVSPLEACDTALATSFSLHETAVTVLDEPPTPRRPTVFVPPTALLANDRSPEAAPVALGVKVTVNAALWPAGIVAGIDMPLRENPELLLVAEEMVTLAPEALSVPV
jgi:hypothetical protein